MANLRKTEIIKILRFNYDLGCLKILRCISTEDKNYIEKNSEIPEPPTTCCNSGCDSCVWIEYAEELIKKCKDGGEIAKAAILEKVKDPSMKAFLLAELRDIEKDNE